MKKFISAGLVFGLACALSAQEAPPPDGSEPDAAAAAADGEAAAAPARPDFFREMAIQYTDEGEYEEAERAYLHALEKDPDNLDIRFRLGTLYLLMERYSEAEPILAKLAEEHPDNAAVQNNLSWIYAAGGKMKNTAKALRHAREALISSPYAPSLWDTLAEGYYAGGQYDQALRAAKHAFELIQLQNATEEQILPYARKIEKIQRARLAFKRFEGLDEDE